MAKRLNLMGVPLDRLGPEQVLVKVADYIRSGRPHQICTVNNEFIVEAQSKPLFLEALKSSNLNLADSVGIVWAARRLTQVALDRYPGADLVNDLARLAAQRGWRIYLLGGQATVAGQAAERLKQTYPKLTIVGAESGLPIEPNRLNDEATLNRLIKRIRQAKPDILLVAFGAPKQEIFIYRYKAQLGVPVMIGVGGTLDFLAGRIKRAPASWRGLGLEWFWRWLQQPSRWRRIWRATITFPLLVIKSQYANQKEPF